MYFINGVLLGSFKEDSFIVQKMYIERRRMLKNFKKQMLMISSSCALGLVGCSNKAVPQSSETTVVAENKENNESSKALEKAVMQLLFL